MNLYKAEKGKAGNRLLFTASCTVTFCMESFLQNDDAQAAVCNFLLEEDQTNTVTHCGDNAMFGDHLPHIRNIQAALDSGTVVIYLHKKKIQLPPTGTHAPVGSS